MFSANSINGASTPRNDSSLRPLLLSHGPLEYTLLIPSNLFTTASQLRSDFQASLPTPTDELASDDEPSSTTELVSSFLSFVTVNAQEQPGVFEDILQIVFREFESRFLNGNEVHSVAATLPGIPLKRKNVVRAYYAARIALSIPIKPHLSALFRAVNDTKNKASIYAVFGGQGNIEEYFEELRESYSIYGSLIEDYIQACATKLLSLASHPDAREFFSKGLNIMAWLNNPESTPDVDYLIDAPVSLPVIGVVQLVHYAVTAKVLGLQPGQLRDLLTGATGHSQGVITAVAIASSTTWDDFLETTLKTLTILFWIGVRTQQKYPRTSLAPSVVRNSVESGEGNPTPMLSVRDLSIKQVEEYVQNTNKHLPPEKHIAISLVNGGKNFVIAGPPQSLYGFNLSLRKIKAKTGLDQARIPYTQRKLRIANKFLPISAPFHSKYSIPAIDTILDDLKDISFPRKDIAIPVFDTFDGHDLRETNKDDTGSVLERLIILIDKLPVHWPLATQFSATHIIDFGPGGSSGLGALTHRNKDGTGVRVILADTFDSSSPELGAKSELFDNEDASVQFAVNWYKEFHPKLVTDSTGKTFVDTKFSRLLGAPPVMVAGMTPTTVPPDFVSATMNAGYHIEIAGGGYFAPEKMTEALEYIESHTFPGAGITINLIYVNPRMMQWGIPLIAELRAKGVPIEGLTIGAGVPSLEVATEYITTLGIKHLGLKPGSIDAIQQVINIAKAHPTFPIVLQWTGGRAGGHHSFEDFHAPLLQMYSRIRRCNNIVLVAGSGFGGSDDTYPYLTGEWSKKFGYPPMPFDGILFGSRMMTAKEAHTSLDAKKAIQAAPGVDDSNWENTYKRPTGGVITVLSEMGEPIHKLATRGVLFWKEMDDTVFALPKAKRVPVLKQKRDHIIKKLNADYQKPWFGRNSQGDSVDIEDMTYTEIIDRLVELMYVSDEKRWIDVTLRNFVGAFIRRMEERFTHALNTPSLLQSFTSLDNPFEFVEKIKTAYPEASQQLINAQDKDFFLLSCLNPTQKPVPFVPALDDNFEFYFKKDSLWQSEDLAAVVDHDVQRTCILQGPVAAKFTTDINQPVKEILDNIHESHIKYLTRDYYHEDSSSIPTIEYFGGKPVSTSSLGDDNDSLTLIEEKGKKIYKIDPEASESSLPSADEWFKLLGGSPLSWRHAFFTSDVFVQGNKYQTNPVKRVFAPIPGIVIEITGSGIEDSAVSVVEKRNGKFIKVAEVRKVKDIILLDLVEFRTFTGNPVALNLEFTYHPDVGFAPIREVMEGRNDRIKSFYKELWFGPKEGSFDTGVNSKFEGDEITINGKNIEDFVHAVGNHGEAFVERQGKVTHAPMDFAIVVGWKAIIKAIFPKVIDGDLLNLVHLNNSFRMCPGQEPLKKGDKVRTVAQINAVVNNDSGKLVEVCGSLYRGSEKVIEVISSFLYRGDYKDFENTFQRKTETPMEIKLNTSKDVAVLMAKEWLSIDDPSVDLLGKTLIFRLNTFVRFKNKSVYSYIHTEGQILLELPSKEIIQIGTVEYEADESHGNPVVDYLLRHGNTIEQPITFDNPIPLNGDTPLTLKAPDSNEGYARVSGDYNPIHVSRVFAAYADLKGNITHGMYTSAAVRSLVETWAADNVIQRVRSYSCSFVGMILPNDSINVTLEHIGMINGRKIIKVEAVNSETEEKVLVGEAEVEQPVSTFVFTGQGSQEQGMGMDLYDSSPVAKSVWDRADTHFLKNYGFSIIQIVKNNPKEYTVHFGGDQGKRIRQNYTSMMFEYTDPEGNMKSEKIFKSITEETTSYTFQSPNGLLSATQFTQPALTLMEKASFDDMKSKGLIPVDCSFAGHSLGEYSALASLGDVMPIESLVDVVFYRGMTMQVAVPRDSEGRSNYGMCAINPSRISPSFDDAALRYVVDHIGQQTGWLLEIVNYNVENIQYVSAGDLRALDTLTNTLNYFKIQKLDFSKLLETMPLEKVKEHLSEIVKEISAKSSAKPQPIDLERGFAVIPLKGISVPFHSSYLRSGVKPFQMFLNKKVPISAVKPANLINKYIPNVTAKPFSLSKEYFQEVYELTGSAKIKSILDKWDTLE